MKTFTATQLNKSAQEVFAAVNEDGAVEIKHDRYPKRSFIIAIDNPLESEKSNRLHYFFKARSIFKSNKEMLS